jgi:hypothetical protein
MGHPCCAVHDCHQPLITGRHRFCSLHQSLSKKCAVNDCEDAVHPGSHTCPNPEHQALEAAYFTQGTALFQLQKRLKNAGLVIPPDSASPDDIATLHGADEDEECVEKPGTGNRQLKAYFSKRRTHNEQLMMRPCGVVLSHATFFGSEAISAVNVRCFPS